MNTSKNIVRKLLSLLLICVFVLLIDRGMAHLLRPVSYADYFNHDIKEIEKNYEEVDLLFVGASRTYRTFVPQIFEEKLELNCVVNAGSSSQPITGTYFELKDLIERIHPKKVILGVTWDQLLSYPNTQSSLIVYDRLSLKNKVLMALECFKDEMKYLLYTYRFKDNFSIEKITSIFRARKQMIANDYYSYAEEGEYYADTGFVYSYKSLTTGSVPIKHFRDFSRDNILSYDKEYLEACFDLCKKNGIDIILASGVTTQMRIYSTGDYQDAVDFYTEFAHEHGTEYYNLNYLKGREDFLPDELMHDYNHCNGEGAKIVSNLFADILLKVEHGEDVSDYFYADIDELKKDVHRIVAVNADITGDENDLLHKHASITSLQNDDVDVLYRLSVKYDDSWKVLVDWTNETELDFTVTKKKDYRIRIEARSSDDSIGRAQRTYKF